ncbi:transposase-like protein [Bacillus tianshenii]|uniref:Transposase-like protein n=1 Tax=Sutcliffiella tianshenii TaxID=1463404 RepID=A0ABS2P690_9BACI|nr:transposase-like protein [Bacillus tianshenii]
MTKFTREVKHQAVQRYINNLVSYRELAKEVGVDHSVLRYWVMLVKHHGEQAFSFPYTKYSPAFKLRVIQFIKDSNYSVREASAIFHIPDPCMVRRWKIKWETWGDAAFNPKEKRPSTMTSKNNKTNEDKAINPSMEEMKKELEYLRMENAYLKKLRALVQEEKSPKKSKRK